jgi:hypothetical protein
MTNGTQIARPTAFLRSRFDLRSMVLRWVSVAHSLGQPESPLNLQAGQEAVVNLPVGAGVSPQSFTITR